MRKKTHDEYVTELAIKNPNIEVIGKYVDSKRKIVHKCKIDGYEWEAAPSNILAGRSCPKCAGNNKRTHIQYMEELKQINPNIKVIGKYINSHTKVLHRCLLDGYEWLVTPEHIIRDTGCPKCAGNIKKTHDKYVKELSIKNTGIKAIDTYINAFTPILHKCIKHNIKWEACPTNLLKGQGCYKCSREKIHIKNGISHEQYISKLNCLSQNIDCVGTYINSNTHTLHKCLICEYIWNVTPNSVITNLGCPKCAGNIKKTQEEYIRDVSLINPDIEVLGEYVSARIPIKHRCKIDGCEWKSNPSNILQGAGCPQCHESSGERYIRQWLEKYNIKFEYQYSFSDCRDVKPLPFDFYLPQNNIVIEYDGLQHYQPIEYFGGEEKFKIQQKHDNIKNEYCKNNGISLLRIPYYKNVEEELNNFLFI